MTCSEFSPSSAFDRSAIQTAVTVAIGIVSLASTLPVFASTAGAGSDIGGVIQDKGGRPVAGAVVTLTDRQHGRATSVYSLPDGGFKAPNLVAG